MNIAIIGGGQMGKYYLKVLQGLQIGSVLVEIDDVKRESLAEANPGLQTFKDTLEMLNTIGIPDGAIVASNTPSHKDIIVMLLEAGVKKIFTEKPLCMHGSEIGAIEEALGNAEIHTAFVIDFSDAVLALRDHMKGFQVLEATVEWGKDRTADSRPTAGNMEDESVHGMKIVRDIIVASHGRPPSSHKVRAMLSHLAYVDQGAQDVAHARDESFPIHPNSSSFILEEFVVDGIPVFVSTRSSFIRIAQERTVCFVFGKIKDGVPTPELHAMLEFDTLDGDVLSLKEMGSGKPVERMVFKNNKLKDQVKAWIDVTPGKEADSRLTPFSDGVYAVRVTEAVKESALGDDKPVLIRPLRAVA